MKLRNLLYATMIACAFASCSNDDDPIDNGGGNETADATLEIQIKSLLTTKATTSMPTDEAEIKSLQLIVFGTDGNVAYLGTAAGKAGENKSVKTTVKAGVQEVLVLANSVTEIRVGMSKAQVLEFDKSFTTENSTNGFSMNSGVFTVNVEAGKTNYVGYANADEVATEVTAKSAVILTTDPVKLYRNVAKVILKTVGISKEIDKGRYPNASLKLKNVYLLHAHTTTKIATATEWGAINVTGAYLNGASDADYGKWVAYMNGKKEIYPYIGTAIYGNDGAYVTSLNNATEIKEGTNKFYAYENTEVETGYRTLLVVEADFSYNKEGEVLTTSEGRFYPIAVGYSGSMDFTKVDFANLRDGKLEGLLRNLEYNVELGVKGPGYTTPFGPNGDEDTFLDVKVQVVNFGYVNQSTEIE